ncbi:DUF6153 family protein [Actinocorallia sp. B10E7]|uniref:DUF6153 family protein n=1 Tax=Actinocorallia sp. B10E7 TaxID=3153558 RepID=UPI00325F01E8
MIGDLQRPAGPNRAALGLLLLITAVLVGLVGMHGLMGAVPTGVSATDRSAPATGHAAGHRHGVDGSAPAEEASADRLCHHHPAGGHIDHAASDCAATGVSAASLPSAPAPSLYIPVAATAAAPSWTSVERAPPDLAELQLLRI